MGNPDIEGSVREACEARDHERAITLLLSNYGDELLAFLVARIGYSDGQEAFSLLCEDIWTGLPKFEWRCSVRTWCYTLARNAAHRTLRSPHHRAERNLTLSGHSTLSQLVQEVRSRTTTYRRTEQRDRFRVLREQLSAEDQTLLILHVDRGLAWNDLAMVMLGDERGEDRATLSREAARLRKRFERVKVNLKRLAKEAGLLDSE